MRRSIPLSFLALSTAFMPALDAGERSKKLYGVRWFPTVEAAIEKGKGKPVFWLRMLGDLDGFS